MTVLGMVAIALGLAGVFRRTPRLVAVALGFGAGLPASAGVVAGGFTVNVFTVVCFIAAIAWAVTRTRPVASTTTTLLVAFAAWSTAVTAIGPWAFVGVPVLLPENGIDNQVGLPSTLVFTSSNLAQTVYLWASILSVLFLVRTRTAGTALWTAAWTGVSASAVRGVLKAVGLDVTGAVFDTMDVDYSPPADPRLRGVFAEPSELATFSLAVAVLAVVAMITTTGRSRASATVLAVLATAVLLASASGTAVTASAAVVAGLLAVLVARFCAAQGRGTPWVVLGGITVAVAALSVGARLAAPVLAIIDDKIGSQSFNSRTAADAIGLRVLPETWGLGAGLGSNRSSSFAVTLLSTVGVPGTLLFAAAIVALVLAAVRRRALLAPMAGLIALLVAKSIAAPDLSTPLLWVLVAATTIVPAACPSECPLMPSDRAGLRVPARAGPPRT